MANSFTTFSLSRSSRTDTVIYGPNGEEVYWVESPHVKIVGNNPTYVYKHSADGGGREPVARLEFHMLKKDLLQCGGQTWELNEMFVPGKSRGHTARLVTTKAGQLTWTLPKRRPELLGPEPESRSFVRYVSNSLWKSKTNPVLEVEPEALPYMDLIVVGWIVAMRDIELEDATHR